MLYCPLYVVCAMSTLHTTHTTYNLHDLMLTNTRQLDTDVRCR